MNSAPPVRVADRRLRPSTPYLSVDLDLLEANIATLAGLARQRGVALRPHAKTHKCSAIARRQIEAGAIGVSCATIDEAEIMVGAGIEGVLITSPIVGEEKIARYLDLLAAAPDLRAVVDDVAATAALSQALTASGLRSGILIDIDVGQHRTGVDPSRALPFAGSISQLSGLRLDGLQAYAGHAQHIVALAERRASAAGVNETVARLRRDLAEFLPTDPIVSGSGTGTHGFDAAAGAFTELQAGSYVFMDIEYGNVEPDGPGGWRFATALHLHTMVVSAPVAGMVTTDAGTKALAVNGPPPRIVTEGYEALAYGFSGDEHGRLTVPEGHPAPPVGTRLRCAVSHCDPTIALHDRIHATRAGRIVDVLPIDARGRR